MTLTAVNGRREQDASGVWIEKPFGHHSVRQTPGPNQP
jgi:hypothetical protein